MLNTTVRRELHEPRSDVMRTRGKAMDCIGLGFAVVIALIANGSFARAHKTVSVTSYPDFVQLCTAFVVGHAAPSHGDSQSLPVLGRFSGDCSQHKKPLLFSFSHENAKNSHIGAANYKPEIHSYMSDFDLDKDRGRWLDFKVSGEGAERQIALAIDFIHYQDTDLTGWPLRYGHLFVGANDLSAVAILEQNVRVEFDIRVPIALLRSQLTKDYSGVRVLIGAVAQWTERPPRINRDHFFEIDLMQTNGYNEFTGIQVTRHVTTDLMTDATTAQPDDLRKAEISVSPPDCTSIISLWAKKVGHISLFRCHQPFVACTGCRRRQHGARRSSRGYISASNLKALFKR